MMRVVVGERVIVSLSFSTSALPPHAASAVPDPMRDPTSATLPESQHSIWKSDGCLEAGGA